MVPWPIGFLALCYGVLATVWAAEGYRVLLRSDVPLWAGLWCALCAAATAGLMLLRPWGRVLAVVGAALLTVALMVVSAAHVAAHHASMAVWIAIGTVVPLGVWRYLSVPRVKKWFVRTVDESMSK